MTKRKEKKIKLTSNNFAKLLIESMEEAVLHTKGKITLSSEKLELPDEPPVYSKTKIKNIREKLLEVSQPVFASILACSPSAIKSWERGENSPNGTTRRLLQLIERDPAYFLRSITEN
jgi:putative transcriptional regulator